VTHHPTQRHMVLAGGEDGSITVWDLRQNTFPVTLLSAHSDTGTAATKMKSCHIKNFTHHSSQLICYEGNETICSPNLKYCFLG
jgi:WD40 repeat protein